MSVGKTARFEVFRRDNFTCKYCGQSAPEVVIDIDYVVPISLGGSDKPSNLVTACRDCNQGKASRSMGDPFAEKVNEDAEGWAEAIRRAAEERRKVREIELRNAHEFYSLWIEYGPGVDLPYDFPQTITRFLSLGLEKSDLAELVVTVDHRGIRDPWRYFCGACHNRVRQIQEQAYFIRQEMKQEDEHGHGED